MEPKEVIVVDIDDELYREIEEAAKLEGKTVDDWATEAIAWYIKKLIAEDQVENES